ncbi:hypothetical protein DICA0_F26302 [Diutina catenulata]
MKLAEALLLRKEYNVKLQDIAGRINSNCLVQEGDSPAEDPNDLMLKYDEVLELVTTLIININLTNSGQKFVFGGSSEPRTMTEALARRDMLGKRVRRLKDTASEGTIRQSQYSRTEVKTVSKVSVQKLQHEADKCAQELRLLDIAIQQANWTLDLIEA